MSEQPLITQETFQESPYHDQSWEIVGEPPQEQVFLPMEVAVLTREQVMLDPMFRDYGGRLESSEKRWHLPRELAVEFEREAAAGKVADEIVDHSIKIEPAELERIKQEAYAAGAAAGKAEAESKQQQYLGAAGKKIESVLLDFKRQLDEGLVRVEQSAVALALSISEKLVGQAVEINPEYILPIVQEALRASGGATVYRVRVSPQDLEFIEVVGLHEQIKGYDGTWKFEKDESVKTGCIVDTSSGDVDFQLDKAWERIQENVMKVVR